MEDDNNDILIDLGYFLGTQYQDVEISVEEQQHIFDLETLMQHFNEQGFRYSTKKGENNIHSKESKRFFRRFFQIGRRHFGSAGGRL